MLNCRRRLGVLLVVGLKQYLAAVDSGLIDSSSPGLRCEDSVLIVAPISRLCVLSEAADHCCTRVLEWALRRKKRRAP